MISHAKTWWLTGLPAAGKSTLAQALFALLEAEGRACCLLDGDLLRQGLCRDLGFSDADRAENVRRTAEVAAMLNRNGIHAIAALISPFAAGREMARTLIGPAHFFEIHVSTALDVCRERDPKGLYRRAEHDASLCLTGVQAPYEIPGTPALVIDTARIDTATAAQHLRALLND